MTSNFYENNYQTNESVWEYKTELPKNTIGELVCPVRRVVSPVKRLISPVKRFVHTVYRTESESISDEQISYIGLMYGNADLGLGRNIDIFAAKAGGQIEISGPAKETQVKAIDVLNGYSTEYASREHNWVSEFMVGKDWLPGHIVFLEAGCSLGKNTFFEQIARTRTRKNILILANRRANREQICERLGIHEKCIFKVADVMSYQALEANGKLWSDELENYDYIVIDEAHYFLKDAAFNSRANISLEKIMKTNHPVKFFTSATLTDFELYLTDKIKRRTNSHFIGSFVSAYKMKRNKQFIDWVACIDESELLNMVKESNEGWLIFVDSKVDGEMLKKAIGADAVFVTAESSYGGGEPAKTYDNLVKTEKLDHRVLIATSVLDNGINIKDRNLKNIFIASDDKTEMVQMLGRKRCLDAGDSFKLFLPYQDKVDLYEKWCLAIADIKLWKEVKKYLLTQQFPPVEFQSDGDDGIKCRDIIYMHEIDRKFYFNELGFQNLKVVANDLMELCKAEDPFLKKVSWLFEDIDTPMIISTPTDVLERKICRVMAQVERYCGKTYFAKTEDFLEFKKVFSSAFWTEFSVDKSENHRVDRPLQPSKINNACRKYGIPIQLVKDKDHKTRKTTYRVDNTT